jgi:hypothetical protein
LVDHGGESSEKTSLETLRRLGCDLDGHLEETKREFVVRLASDPESELLMNFDTLRIKNFFHLSHEFERQVAVVKNDPLASYETSLDHFKSGLFLLLTHRYFAGRELLLLLGVLVDVTGGISTR